MKKTNRILVVALILGLGVSLMPSAVFGAYNDVTLTTDTVITVGSNNFNVSGSSAVVESISVGATSFSFTLSSNSQIQVTSADRLDINGVSGTSAEFKTAKTCTSAESVTLFLPVSTATNNITVTPTTGTCTVPAASTNTSGSSSGRGGGGGATTLAVSVPASVAPTVVATGGSVFSRNLNVGSTGDDVRNLQTRLLGEGFFKGSVTGYFGPITQKAVKAFQAKYGIDQLGIVGPATRAQLNKVFMANVQSNATTTTQLTPAQISAITAQINTLLKQAQELQAQLKALGN